MTRTFPAVSRICLSEQVALQLAAAIDAGKWRSGEKLPSEAELRRQFEVGRSTVREALRSLAYIGKVQMRAGEGTYVTGGNLKFLGRVFTSGPLQNERELTDLYEARIVLEMASASFCARRVSPEELAQLEELIRDMGAAAHRHDLEDFARLDIKFHETIAAASKNHVLVQCVNAIRGLLQEVVLKGLQIPGDLEIAHTQHGEILGAIKLGSAAKARKAMRNHLEVFMRGYELFRNISGSEPGAH